MRVQVQRNASSRALPEFDVIGRPDRRARAQRLQLPTSPTNVDAPPATPSEAAARELLVACVNQMAVPGFLFNPLNMARARLQLQPAAERQALFWRFRLPSHDRAKRWRAFAVQVRRDNVHAARILVWRIAMGSVHSN